MQPLAEFDRKHGRHARRLRRRITSTRELPRPGDRERPDRRRPPAGGVADRRRPGVGGIQAVRRATPSRPTWTATPRSWCSAATSTRTTDPNGNPGAPWFPALESLLRKAVRNKVPTLGVCLGGQLLATAMGGTVERSASGPEIGAKLVARRDAAEYDTLWRYVPFVPDVLQWHHRRDHRAAGRRHAARRLDPISAPGVPDGRPGLGPAVPHRVRRRDDRRLGRLQYRRCWPISAPTRPRSSRSAPPCSTTSRMSGSRSPLRFAAVARGELEVLPARHLPLLGH